MFSTIVFNIESLISIIISISDVAVSFCSNQTQVISFTCRKSTFSIYNSIFDIYNDITCVWLLQDDTATSDIDIMILTSDSILNIIVLNIWLESY
jgi:hypothetical protein